MKRNLIIIISVFFMISPAGAADVSIQAENFTGSHNIGGALISPLASYLTGLDYTGEWTEYSYYISSFGTRSAALACRGYDGIAYHLRLTLTPAEGGIAEVVDFQFTGSGCG